MSGEDEKNSSSTQTPTANTSTYVPGRVGIVGLGLMGGSFAKAFAKGGREVYAWNRTHATVELAMVETIKVNLHQTLCRLVSSLFFVAILKSACNGLRTCKTSSLSSCHCY